MSPLKRKKLNKIRLKLDRLDNSLIKLIKQRTNLVNQVLKLKDKPNFIKTDALVIDGNLTNTHMLGNVLYTQYIHLFQVAGVILLLAMIGAIVLTYTKREGVKTQSYFTQLSREKNTSITLAKAEFNKGVKVDD